MTTSNKSDSLHPLKVGGFSPTLLMILRAGHGTAWLGRAGHGGAWLGKARRGN
jgi:hypothetical protein